MSDWSLVDYPSDPIPDDPGVVAAQIEHILGVAADIRAQVERLPSSGDVDALVWNDNPAATSFKECCKKLPKDLDALNTRYGAVGAALTTFNATLRSTKAAARANLVLATNAHGSMTAAASGVTQMNEFKTQAAHQASLVNASAPAGTAPVTPASWTGPDYPAQLSAATTEFNRAKAAVDAAVQEFQRAASTAKDAVNAATHDGLKNHTGFWHWAGNLLGSAAHAVATHIPLKAIASVCGQLAGLAALLSFIPVVGQVADVAALSLGAVALTADAINAANDAYEGNFTWSGDGFSLVQNAVTLIPGAKEAEDVESGLKAGETIERDSETVERDSTGLEHGLHSVDGPESGGAGDGGSGAGGGGDKSLVLYYKRGWTASQKAEADTKVAQLDRLAQEGRLERTLPEARDPGVRQQFVNGGPVPPGKEVDHIHDLQLGGKDEVANMQYLDKSVNRSLGPQLMHRVKYDELQTPYSGVSIQVRPPRPPRIRLPKVSVGPGNGGSAP